MISHHPLAVPHPLWRTNHATHGTLLALLIVRGREILPSTAAQLFMVGQLGAEGFRRAYFIHHPLVTSRAGRKLSMSDNALSLKAMRAARVTACAIYPLTAAELGIDPAGGVELAELLTGGSGGGERWAAKLTLGCPGEIRPRPTAGGPCA